MNYRDSTVERAQNDLKECVDELSELSEQIRSLVERNEHLRLQEKQIRAFLDEIREPYDCSDEEIERTDFLDGFHAESTLRADAAERLQAQAEKGEQ